MRKNLIFNDGEIEFLKYLVKNRVEFMVVGLSAAALQGAPVVTQDIDLWFKDLKDPGIQKALKKVDGVFVPSFEMNPPCFAGESVKLFDIVTHMDGLDNFEKEKRNTEKISLGKNSFRILSIERIIKSKEVANRSKDKIVVPVLKDALVVIKQKKKKIRRSVR